MGLSRVVAERAKGLLARRGVHVVGFFDVSLVWSMAFVLSCVWIVRSLVLSCGWNV